MTHARPSRILPLALLVIGALSARPTPALAETESERAARYYEAGNAAFEAKNWLAAEAAYRETWRVARTFDVAANLGVVELRLGKYRAAAELLAYSLRNVPPSSKPAQRQRTQQLFDEARPHVAALRLRVTVPGASVTVDGAPVAAEDVPFEVFVDPGEHAVDATRDGYQPGHAVVTVAAGGTSDVELSMTAAPESRSKVPWIVLGAGSVVALGVGIGTTVVSNAKSSDANAQRTAILSGGGQCVQPTGASVSACAQLKSTLQSADTTANVARGAFISAGVLAVGAVVYVLLPGPRSGSASTASVQIQPVAGPERIGLILTRAW